MDGIPDLGPMGLGMQIAQRMLPQVVRLAVLMQIDTTLFGWGIR